MATVGAGVASATVLSSVPVVGWVVGIAAAYIDQTYLLPKLAGKGGSAARPPILQGVPVGSNEAGAPRIFAIGRRVRIPTHILWQERKVRETQSNANTNKGGTSTVLRRVYISAMVAVNDRKTNALVQLIGNGKLIVYKTRNIYGVTTSEMSAAYSAAGPLGARVVVSMASSEEPSFTDTLAVGDYVIPSGFVYVSGPTTFNNTYFEVVEVTDHAAGAPSRVSLAPRDGQTIASVSYTGGSIFTPAAVTRVDNAMLLDPANAFGVFTSGVNQLRLDDPTNGLRDDVFNPGDLVRVRNAEHDTIPATPISSTSVWSVASSSTGRLLLVAVSGPGVTPGVYTEVSATQVIIVEFINEDLFSSGIFPPDYEPEANFYDGSDDQGENPLLVADKGTGNIPAYRGVSYQTFDQFFATQFGDQLPYSLEALIEADPSLTWREAAAIVLERGGVPSGAIDTSGMPDRPFFGMYLRGAVPTLTAMQPMLVAGQLIGQERDGTIALFTVDTADVVQVENGDAFTDFGMIVQGEQRIDNKVVVEDQSEEDMPTSVGIRHQDPDNQFADGYQHFGLRSPQGVSHQNEQELDLSNIVLTRKEARNLAATVMRRAWVNRKTYRFMLPAAYLDVLENDVMTFTTDSGEDVRCRIIQRDVGADFRVSVTAIAEDVDLAVVGSPVQTGAGLPAPIVVPTALVLAVAIDAPGIRNSEVTTPGIKFALCAQGGGANWAGCAIYESVDGASYQQIGIVSNQAAIATLDGTLSAQTASEEYGTATVTLRAQTVDVTFAYEGGAIEAATQSEAEAGKNWVAIYDGTEVEIAAFTTVTPNGDRSYTLGGWLRGLRGTTSIDRYAGAQMVMLWPVQDNVFFRQFPGSILPTSLEYKFVPSGQSIDNVTGGAVEATWLNARPLPVRSVSKTIGASPYDARLEVDAHWSRSVLPLGTQPPHPMDEPFEAYRFDIYDPTGVTLLRSKILTAQGSGSTTLRDKWVTYTAAEQTTDGYTPSGTETFWVDVVQVGEFGDSPSILAEI
jgi:hypothetical protein